MTHGSVHPTSASPHCPALEFHRCVWIAEASPIERGTVACVFSSNPFLLVFFTLFDFLAGDQSPLPLSHLRNQRLKETSVPTRQVTLLHRQHAPRRFMEECLNRTSDLPPKTAKPFAFSAHWDSRTRRHSIGVAHQKQSRACLLLPAGQINRSDALLLTATQRSRSCVWEKHGPREE